MSVELRRAARLILAAACATLGVGGALLLVDAACSRPVPRVVSATPTPAPPGAQARPWAPFRLTDQDGRTVSDVALRGRVVVADFIFTRCAGACPARTARMALLLRRLPGEDYRFVSFSVDPEHDTTDVLAAYAQRWTGDLGRWHFLAVGGEALERLARSVGTSVFRGDDGQTTPGDRFALVGPDGAVRGSYAAASPTELDRLVIDARALRPTPGGEEEPAGDAPPHDGAELFLVRGCMGCHRQPRLAPPLGGQRGGRPVLDARAIVTLR